MMNKQNSLQTWLMCLVMLAFMLQMLTALPCTVRAQAAKPASLTDPKELEAFLDPIFAEQMGKLHIPGAAIAVVKDGKIVFSKGYGYANLEKKFARDRRQNNISNRLDYESIYGDLIGPIG